MNRDEFDGLIRRLEDFARARPGAYTVRVGLLAALGFSYLFGVLVLLLACTPGLAALVIAFPNALTIKLALVFGAVTIGMSAAIFRAFWVRLPLPDGLELKRQKAPALFAMLDDLRSKLNAPRVHHVLLTGDFNAAVVQVPRLGVFGWQKNYLILGLPLMQGLTPDQFRSVIAHEFGHLSRNHSRFAAWIYRVRRTWDRVFEQMGRQRQRGAGLLLSFIRWYGPYFNAYSFVLARRNEYDADRCAVELAGLRTAAQALIRTQVQGRLLSQSFWPELFQRAAAQPAPPAQAFVDLANTLRAGPAPEDARKWLNQAIQIRTSNADTHPCLKDRLEAMGFLSGNESSADGEWFGFPGASAAEQLCGEAQADFRAELERRWQKSVAKNWKERFDHVQQLQKRLAELELRTGGTPPPLPDELWERARIVSDLRGDAAAEPLLRDVLALRRDHPGANFILGRQRLAGDDPAGVEFLERAMKADPTAVRAACDLLYAYYQRSGQHDKIPALFERFDRHAADLQRAQEERVRVTANDSFLPHELDAAKLDDLRRQLREFEDVGAAQLARKAVRYFPDSPLYVLAVRPDARWFQFRSASANQQLVRRLVNELKLPGQTLIFVAEKNLAGLGRKISRVPGAEIFVRGRN